MNNPKPSHVIKYEYRDGEKLPYPEKNCIKAIIKQLETEL